MKKCIKFIIAAAGIAGMSSADLSFPDQFDRADGSLGANWDVIWGTVAITNQQAYMPSTVDSGINGMGLVGVAIQNQVELGAEFSMQIEVAGGTPTARGIIFNYTATNSFYAFRLLSTGIQFGKISGAGTNVNYFTVLSQDFTPSAANTYQFIVNASAPGEFELILNEIAGGITNEVYNKSWVDAGTALTGGYSGFYLNGGTGPKFDNFIVTTVPEPVTIGLLGISTAVLFIARRKIKR